MFDSFVRSHLEGYWRLTRQLFSAGDHAVAAFLAITLIEEIGKIPILQSALKGDKSSLRKLRDHKGKYEIAASWTLLVNSRVTRIYGEDEMRFARWLRDKELLEIRNAALYLDVKGSTVTVPNRAVDVADARLLICIAGEVYAEIQGQLTGTGPKEWMRILVEVDDFRTTSNRP